MPVSDCSNTVDLASPPRLARLLLQLNRSNLMPRVSFVYYVQGMCGRSPVDIADNPVTPDLSTILSSRPRTHHVCTERELDTFYHWKLVPNVSLRPL